ncbi:unnamed protein product [Ixodes persulcatus]
MRYTNITMLHKNSYPRRPARHFRKHNKGNKLQTSVLGRVSTMPGRTKCTSAAAKGEFSFFPGDEEGEMPAFEAVSRPATTATVCSSSRSGKPSLKHGLKKI